MEQGKLIVIAGTDCSGKETQTKMLITRYIEEALKITTGSYPKYDSATGKIVGGAYLGKKHIGESYFEEGAANVDPLVAAPMFAMDRRYDRPNLLALLESGINVILDRYVTANLAHQGGKIKSEEERLEMYSKLEILEYGLNNKKIFDDIFSQVKGALNSKDLELVKAAFNVIKNGIMELPRPDQVIFLHMPYWAACRLKEGREEAPDGHEASPEHLKDAEAAYLQLAELNNWTTISCVEGDRILTPEEIHEKVYEACVLTNSKTINL